MKILILILFFFPLFSVAQQYSEVIEIPNNTANQLYSSAKEWFAITFKSANNVIQLDDPIEKKIVGKGIKEPEWVVKNISENLKVYFTLIVQFKDGRYKYDIQSTEIKIYAGASYTYDELKKTGTEDGLKAVYEKMGIKSGRVNKLVFKERLESNKSAVLEVENSLREIVDDLTLALKKGGQTNNW